MSNLRNICGNLFAETEYVKDDEKFSGLQYWGTNCLIIRTGAAEKERYF